MVSPKNGERLSNTRWRKMKLRTVSGAVHLRVKVGYSQGQRRWLNPIRQGWALAPYQQVSPELQARVCQTATLVPTYEGAVQAARCWGCAVSDDLIHRPGLWQKLWGSATHFRGAFNQFSISRLVHK